MSILYVKEHLRCKYYQKSDPTIKVIDICKGKKIEKDISGEPRIILMVKGTLKVSSNDILDKIFNEGEIGFLYPGNTLRCTALEDSHIISIIIGKHIHLCESFSITELFPYCKKKGYDAQTLKFTPQVKVYATQLEEYLKDGINCFEFHELKRQELFYIFRAYYNKEELASFFYPILDREDIYFKKFVLENYLRAKNVKELAEMASYSTSGFIKKFVRCFDESPYRWMRTMKAKRILYDLHMEEKSIKEISTDYSFSSMSHFIEFCKKQYGATPGKLRKERLISNPTTIKE